MVDDIFRKSLKNHSYKILTFLLKNGHTLSDKYMDMVYKSKSKALLRTLLRNHVPIEMKFKHVNITFLRILREEYDVDCSSYMKKMPVNHAHCKYLLQGPKSLNKIHKKGLCFS